MGRRARGPPTPLRTGAKLASLTLARDIPNQSHRSIAYRRQRRPGVRRSRPSLALAERLRRPRPTGAASKAQAPCCPRRWTTALRHAAASCGARPSLQARDLAAGAQVDRAPVRDARAEGAPLSTTRGSNSGRFIPAHSTIGGPTARIADLLRGSLWAAPVATKGLVANRR